MNSIPHKLNFMITPFIATFTKERDRCLEWKGQMVLLETWGFTVD